MKVTCPECAERFDVSSDMIGKKAKCGECAHVFVVPEAVEKKARKSDADTTQTTWLSLYHALMATLLLLFRGQQGGMIASVIFALAIETAAIFLAFRGFRIIWPFRGSAGENQLITTSILVNGILIGLLGLSLLLTLYTLIAGQSAGGLGGLGSGAGDIMKYFNELQKNLPK